MARRFRFFATYTNAPGSTRDTSIHDGYAVHVRGWDAGAKITCRKDDEGRDRTDTFDLAMTHGSHGAGRDVHLGTVRDAPAGPVWIPAATPTTARIRELLKVMISDARQDVVYPEDVTELAGLVLAMLGNDRAADETVFGPHL